MTNMLHRTVRITYARTRVWAAAYMLLPVPLFLIGFVRWYIALAGLCAVALAFRGILRDARGKTLRDQPVELSISSLAIVFALMLLWTQIGGMNGYMFQTSDWAMRNAVFRDLIFHRWPVRYEGVNTALVYYVGHWLPEALVGKAANAIFHSPRLAWFLARMALWVWTSLGLTVIALLLFLYARAVTRGKRVIAILVLIFFSGLDIIGTFINNKQGRFFDPKHLHLEWWARVGSEAYQYSSITTCLYWVFNQAVIPWMATLCFLMDADESHYVAYGAACLISGPLPLVGLAVMMVARALCRLVACLRQKRAMDWLRAVFSPGNLLLALLCMPVMALYLLGSSAIDATAQSRYAQAQISLFSSQYWTGNLLLFLLLEAGVYLLPLWHAHRRDPLFYIVAVTLACIPYFHVGKGIDFCMRASIPGIMIMLAYVAEYLCDNLLPEGAVRASERGARLRRACAMLVALICLCGAATPGLEIYRSFYRVITQRTVRLANDTIGTLDGDLEGYYFIMPEPDEHFFYKYIAR